jgi:membrane-bound lytic murein transglycosylase D
VDGMDRLTWVCQNSSDPSSLGTTPSRRPSLPETTGDLMLRTSLAVLMLAVMAPSAHAKKPKKKSVDDTIPLVVEDGTEVPEDAVEVEDDTPPPNREELEAALETLRRADSQSLQDVMAEDPPDEGIWAWVQRMEDEVPSQEQVNAIHEKNEEDSAERAVIDDLVPEPIADQVYEDPSKPADPLHLDKVDPAEFDIPVVVNDEVRKWVKWFTGPVGRKYYQRWLERSSRYRPMMYAELERKGLPRDLVYVSMVESGYNAHAYSHAHAAGLWQFIPSTARLYKMRVDWWVDDRRDPGHSVVAAAEFLGELHKMFGDWHLAWSAYNAGPGRVRRATSNAGSKDFWVLSRGDHLPGETDNYVPKIIAAAIIGHHPERYGFKDLKYQEELVYDVQHVDGSVDMAVLAKCAGVSVEEIQALNPGLRRWATPPEGYDVRVPKGRQTKFASALSNVPKSKRLTFTKHKVARGETLSVIADKYSVKVDDIVLANRLKSANRIYVGASLVIPVGGGVNGSIARTPSKSSSQRAVKTSTRSSTTYVVNSGDTLSGIASRHSVSVSEIRSWNSLRGDTIFVGQKLTMRAGSGGGTTTSTYTVSRGDNLSTIASRYGVRVSDLVTWNKLKDSSHIYVGQKLTVKVGSSSWKTYKVKSGDSLGGIASKNGCSVADIQRWNSLSGTVIQPGQALRLK